MFQLSNSAQLLALLSSLVLLTVLRSFNDTLYSLDLSHFAGPSVSLIGTTIGGARGNGAGSCRMAWMRPDYLKLSGLKSRLEEKYEAYLYREQGLDNDLEVRMLTCYRFDSLPADAIHPSHQPRGSPVLFVPGNSGSFQQIRSLASAAARLYHKEKSFTASDRRHSTLRHPGLDFFTMHFNEDLSAFHGATLLEQAEYTNDLVAHILDMYARSRQSQSSSLPIPTAVLIVAHSMGGIVARKMLRMPNYIHGSINTIISLSTPHIFPPIPLDRGIEVIYDDINNFWRESYFGNSSAKSQPDLLLVSISGSTSDTTVSPDSSSLLSLAPYPNGLTFFTTGMPEVWTPIDHRAVLWCDQLRTVIVKALLALTDPEIPSQVKPLNDRALILESYFTNGHGLLPRSSDLQEILTSLRDPTSPKLHHPRSALSLGPDDLRRPAPLTHIVSLRDEPVSESASGFTLLTNLPVGDRLHVMACNNTINSDQQVSCVSLAPDYLIILPSSHFSHPPPAVPGPDDEPLPHDVFYFINVPMSDISLHESVVIHISNSPTKVDTLNGSDFLLSGNGIKEATKALQASLWTLIFRGLQLPQFPWTRTLASQLHLPGIDTSLLAFKIQVTYPSTCATQASFAPLMQQHTPILNESKFHPNVKSALLYTHYSTAFSPTLKSAGPQGMILTFWADPQACSTTSEEEAGSLTIRLDIYESLRKIILRYRTALVTIPLAVVSTAFALQIRHYRASGTFPPIGVPLSILLDKYLLTVLLGLVGVHIIQSTILNASRYQLGPVDNASSTPESLATSSTWVTGLLLGDHHLEYAFLSCCIFLVGLGWTIITTAILNLFLISLAKSFNTIARIVSPKYSTETTA